MKVHLNRYKIANGILVIGFYFLFSFLHFDRIIHFEDFNYVAYYNSISFQFEWSRYVLASFIILFNATFLIFFRQEEFVYSILVLLLFFFVIPSALVFSSGVTVFPIIFLLHNLFFYTVVLFGQIKWKVHTPVLNIRQSTTALFLLVLVGLIPFVIIYGPYLNLRNLLLIDIYETRNSVREDIGNFYTSYTYSWFSKAIIPLLIVFFIYYRRYFKLLLSILALIFLFLCGAHKMVFAGLFLMLIFYKYDYLKKTMLFLSGMMALLVISIFSSYVIGYDYIWDITFRRVLMLTALLDYCYFDFFANNPIYWSDSFLSRWVPYDFDLPSTYLIGKEYFNKPNLNANVGIISDGFKNLGVLGSIFYVFLVAIYISILNSLQISAKFYGLFVLLVFSFLNSALSTIMVTHGGLLLLLLAILVLNGTRQKMDML